MPEAGETNDLATLSNLDEATLLEELQRRYSQDRVYTYVGDILVALNPFKGLPIYSPEHQRRYRNVELSLLDPHIYALADVAYQQMCDTGKTQCFIISGESGAGKTESAKLIVSQLMELSNGQSVLEQRILQANPLLEAFGNARTTINNNSSRFGKYLQLKFQNSQVTGAKINEYLLEKSRVVSQGPGERNFHIFYSMFAGLDADKKTSLFLTSPSDFKYLKGGGDSPPPHQNESAQFAEVTNALDLVGFESEFQDDIFVCLSGILHLGNIVFYNDLNDYAHIVSSLSGPVRSAAELLGINLQHLVEVLTVSVSFARGEAIKRHLNHQGAEAARDALAKALYDRVFRWIVNRINQLLAPTAAEMVGGCEIGILDIFGFEKFERNSFEQMCINIANEQLHYFFVEHVFLLETEEYRNEDLGLLYVQFSDNKPLLEMFLGKPIGVFALLDEQCSFPKATDKTFISKLNQIMKKKKCPFFVASKSTASSTFSIVHYAGKVEYDCTGFLDRNRDSLPSNALGLLRTSTNDLIKLIFTASVTKTGTLALSRLTAQRLRKKGRDSKKQKHSAPVTASKPPTIGAQFKNSLSVLLEKMKAAVPFFVRCIKPNTLKSPGHFDAAAVLSQLRYTGMLETVRVRKEGYSYRPPFHEFVERYGAVTDLRESQTLVESCQRIVEQVGVDGCRIGLTKVFVKYWYLEKLKKELVRVHRAAVVLQKISRGFVERCKFRVRLALKREQEIKVAALLHSIRTNSEGLFQAQLVLCEADLADTPLPSAPPLALLHLQPAPPPPSAPPLSVVTQQNGPIFFPRTLLLPPPPPPPDLTRPPAEPHFSDSDTEEELPLRAEGVSEAAMEDIYVATTQRMDTFKRTKAAVLQWFEKTQVPLLSPPPYSAPPRWLHATVTRGEAETALAPKPLGTFLLRLCESRFGFSLSVKASGRVLHLVISQLETGKYVVVGHPKVHSTLRALVAFHSKPRLQASSFSSYSSNVGGTRRRRGRPGDDEAVTTSLCARSHFCLIIVVSAKHNLLA